MPNCFRSRVRSFWGGFNRIRLAKRFLREYGRFLQDGVYYLLPNLRTYVHEDAVETCIQALSYRRWNGFRDWIVKTLGRTRVRNSGTSRDRELQGSVLYVNNSYPAVKRVKIFDFAQRNVIVFCLSEEEFQREIFIHDAVCPFWGAPAIKQKDYQAKMFVEELICEYPRDKIDSGLKDKIYCDLLEKYTRYLEKEKVAGGGGKKEYLRIMQHNDLSMANVICDLEGKVHVIDWEHVGDNVFFYDLMRLVIHEAQNEHDTWLLRQYFSGEYDQRFLRYFHAAGTVFLPSQRKRYLLEAFDIMVNRAEQDWQQEQLRQMKPAFEMLIGECSPEMGSGNPISV